MTVRKRVRVHGAVQGVFFRDSVRRAALPCGVAGWVSNRSDGTVEAVFEGDGGDVDRMVEICRDSPGHSRVSRVDVADEEPEGLDGFQIR
jgi:acylphosphatase